MHHKQKLYTNPNLIIAFSITLIVVMGVTNITPALPAMATFFNIPYSSVALLITVFTMPGIIVTPILGIVSDRIGRRILIIPSLLIFGITGTIMFFVKDFSWLLILRFIQGVGVSALGAINTTIIGDMFTGNDRTAAFGYNASVLNIGTAAYPVIGGLLCIAGWNYPFLLSAFAFVVAWFVIFHLHNPEPVNEVALKDYFKTIAAIIKKPYIIGLLSTNILTFTLLYGPIITYFPYIISYRFNGDSATIGLIMSLMSIVTAITATQLQWLSTRFSEKNLIFYSFLGFAISFIIAGLAQNYFWLTVAIIIGGASNAINNPSLLSLLTGAAPTHYRGAIMSLNGMGLRVGQTVGPIIMAMLLAIVTIDIAFYIIGGATVIITIALFSTLLSNREYTVKT
ncbi:MAG TPA: MFS transporter [Spirochaetota bacterium]|nr:MFS transporter [Spirochaetota bacterium]HOM88759.1 MFS transporter [Spirochaetota bacterium]HOT19563.1 MFS transporter [Spirochaetota bacterium]HPD05158.1 MFS transporter [Spirochaetota bacterium]HPK44641.1 MFS transporter [Spirochaetota bacterium]